MMIIELDMRNIKAEDLLDDRKLNQLLTAGAQPKGPPDT